jgi:hypothetical protein
VYHTAYQQGSPHCTSEICTTCIAPPAVRKSCAGYDLQPFNFMSRLL